MAPPKYEDLGKDAKDLLSKNYHFGDVKIQAKTTAANGITEFIADGTHNPKDGTVGASLETKWSDLYGFVFSEKWTTDNVISSHLTYDKISNLKFDAETTFQPVSGEKSFKCKVAHQSDYSHLLADVDLDFAGPTINGSAVFGYENLYAGYQASYDTANSKLVANNVSLGYKGSDFVVHGAILDASKFVGSVHHNVSDSLSAAAELKWASGSDTNSLTLGVKKALENKSFVKAKVDNNLQLGLSYGHLLDSGLQITFSGLLDGKEQGGHKLGLHLDFQA